MGVKPRLHHTNWTQLTGLGPGSDLAGPVQFSSVSEVWTLFKLNANANAHRPKFRLDLTVTSGVTRSWMARGSHSFTCHRHVYPRMEWAILPFCHSAARRLGPMQLRQLISLVLTRIASTASRPRCGLLHACLDDTRSVILCVCLSMSLCVSHASELCKKPAEPSTPFVRGGGTRALAQERKVHYYKITDVIIYDVI